MAIQLVSVSNDQQNGGITSLTIPKPTGTVSGDIIIICVYVNDNITIRDGFTTPTNFTNIIYEEQLTTYGAIGSWWKRAGSTEPSSYTVSWANSSTSATGIAATFRGCVSSGDILNGFSGDEGVIGNYLTVTLNASPISGYVTVSFAAADEGSSSSTLTLWDDYNNYTMTDISGDIGGGNSGAPLTKMATATLGTNYVLPNANSDDPTAYGAMVAFTIKAQPNFSFTPIPITTVSVA